MTNAGSGYPGQFILGRAEFPAPDGWLSDSIGPWVLKRHRSLPAMRLTGRDGKDVGWILGYPIDGEGAMPADGTGVVVPWGADGFDKAVEEFVYGFGGRFLAAFVGGGRKRLYLDPTGSLSVVYCAHQGVAASTPNLIPYDERTGKNEPLVRDLGIPHTNAKYPLELTPRFNVLRLLPNHYLDLENWAAVRHWPVGTLADDGSVEKAAASVAAITKRQISAVVSRYPTYLRMTAGGDSRMLLACAKGVKDRLELFTVPLPDDGAYLDVAVARRIAERFDIPHLVPKVEKSSPKDLDDFMERIGYGTGELRGWQAVTMFRKANPAYAQLDGAVGALDRGGFYRDKDTRDSGLTPERLMTHCQGPATERTLPPLRRWLETAPELDTFQLLDLFFVEQLLGCWSGVLPYAEGGDPGFILYPMCHREVVTSMMTLPTEYRLHGYRVCEKHHSGSPPFMEEIIRREWPELLEWPFNTRFGTTKLVLDVKEILRKIQSQVAIFS